MADASNTKVSVAPGAMVWAGVERPEAFRSFTMIGAFVRDANVRVHRNVGDGGVVRGEPFA